MRSTRNDPDSSLPASAEHKPALRTALGRFATGVTVITTCDRQGGREGLTANSFGAVSLDPPLVHWNLQRSAGSLPRFLAAEHFAVNVLAASQQALSQHFARGSADKFHGIRFHAGVGGCPLLPDSLATIECRTVRKLEAGDHVLFIGEVLRFAEQEGRPLIFSGGEYRQLAPARDPG